MKKVNYSLSNVTRLFSANSSHLLKQSDMQGAYFAEHGSYDARPMAVQQALLIDGVMTNQVFHHQQKSSYAVSL